MSFVREWQTVTVASMDCRICDTGMPTMLDLRAIESSNRVESRLRAVKFVILKPHPHSLDLIM